MTSDPSDPTPRPAGHARSPALFEEQTLSTLKLLKLAYGERPVDWDGLSEVLQQISDENPPPDDNAGRAAPPE